MKWIFLFAFLFIFSVAYSQKKSTAKIIITTTDTTQLYEKVKTALIKSDFIVKDIQSDTLITYPRELNRMNGYVVAVATLTGNIITLNGYYSLKRQDYFGYEKRKTYKRIIKFNGSKLWPLLEKIASYVGGEVSYSE